jgi:hypothetical protein
MRFLTCLLFAGLSAYASVLVPVVTPDGQALTGPAVGAQLIPHPGALFGFCGNDNTIGSIGNDADCNEPIVTALFGPTSFLMTFTGNNSSLSNYFTVTGQTGQVGPSPYSPFATFTYTPGVTVPLEYHVQGGAVYLPGSPNVGEWCTRGCGNTDPNPTPEPMSLAMVGAGLVSLAWLRRKRLA